MSENYREKGSVLVISLLAIMGVVILLTSFISISKDASFESLKVVEREKTRLKELTAEVEDTYSYQHTMESMECAPFKSESNKNEPWNMVPYTQNRTTNIKSTKGKDVRVFFDRYTDDANPSHLFDKVKLKYYKGVTLECEELYKPMFIPEDTPSMLGYSIVTSNIIRNNSNYSSYIDENISNEWIRSDNNDIYIPPNIDANRLSHDNIEYYQHQIEGYIGRFYNKHLSNISSYVTDDGYLISRYESDIYNTQYPKRVIVLRDRTVRLTNSFVSTPIENVTIMAKNIFTNANSYYNHVRYFFPNDSHEINFIASGIVVLRFFWRSSYPDYLALNRPESGDFYAFSFNGLIYASRVSVDLRNLSGSSTHPTRMPSFRFKGTMYAPAEVSLNPYCNITNPIKGKIEINSSYWNTKMASIVGWHDWIPPMPAKYTIDGERKYY